MISKLSLPPGIKWETYNKRLSGVNGSPVVVYGAVKAQIIMNSNLLDIDLVVVHEQTINHELLIGRDFVTENDLGLVLIDRDSKIVISNKSSYDIEQMKEVCNDSNESVFEVHET